MPRSSTRDINLSDTRHVGTHDVEQVIRSWDASRLRYLRFAVIEYVERVILFGIGGMFRR